MTDETMLPFIPGDGFTLTPELIGSFTVGELKQRCFRFDVEHDDCDGDHKAIRYSAMRPEPTEDMWLVATEEMDQSSSDEEFVEYCREALTEKAIVDDYRKLTLIFGRPWCALVRRPIDTLLQQTACIEQMPPVWKKLVLDRSIAEVRRAVSEAEGYDPGDPDEENWFRPVLEALADLYGNSDTEYEL